MIILIQGPRAGRQYSPPLGGRLAGRSRPAVLASVASGHRKAADAAGEEGEWIVLVVAAVGVAVIEIVRARGRPVAGRLEGSLSGPAVEGAGRVRSRGRSETAMGVKRARVSCCATAQTGREVVARGTAKVLLVVPARSERASRRKGAGSRSSAHRALAHAILRRIVHGGWVSGIGHDSSSGTARTAAKTADVLGEVVITANFVSTLPITGTEGHYSTATHSSTTVTAHGAVVAAMGRRRHHGRRSVATVSIRVSAHVVPRAGSDCWEGASEAGSSALEVGETTRGAGPVTRTRAVLARWEGRQNILSAVENTARRRRDLDGLLVQGTAIHAKTLGSLLGKNVRMWHEG